MNIKKGIIKCCAILCCISLFGCGCKSNNTLSDLSSGETESITNSVSQASSSNISEASKSDTGNQSSDIGVSHAPTSSNSQVSNDITSSEDDSDMPGTEPTKTITAPAKPSSWSWTSHPNDYKLIALTFDDAPNNFSAKAGDSTKTIIDTLNKYEGAGTLFCTGDRIRTFGTSLLEYAVEHWFELGNHTNTHTDIITSAFISAHPNYSKDDYLNGEILPVQKLLQERMGITPKFLRPSGAHTTKQSVVACIQAGLPIILGDRDESGENSAGASAAELDKNATAEQLRDAMINSAFDGQIFLLHSTSAKTASIIDEACKALYENNYRFVTLSELFEYKCGVKDVSQIDISKSLKGQQPTRGINSAKDIVLK